ncbi:MAG: flagellar brake protein [Acidiferrobacterales bacterium]
MIDEPPDPFQEYSPEIERISLAPQIMSLLSRLQESRSLLSVTVAGSDELYNSAIVEVDTELGYILLDELAPVEGHLRLLQSRALHAHARLRGVDISFAGTLEEAGEKDGIAFYKLPIPALVNYRQRRSNFRARVGLGTPVSVELGSRQTPELDGTLYDISRGGIGAMMHAGNKTDLHQGSVFDRCEIRLPRGHAVTCGLEICYVTSDERRHALRIGGRYIDLGRTQEKIIAQFVAAMERELLRKMPKD